MDINQYEKAYNEVFARTGDKDVSMFIVGQMAKDQRTNEINKNGTNGNGHSTGDAATPNQLGYLRKLGISVKPGLTKSEASRLLDEANGKK